MFYLIISIIVLILAAFLFLGALLAPKTDISIGILLLIFFIHIERLIISPFNAAFIINSISALFILLTIPLVAKKNERD